MNEKTFMKINKKAFTLVELLVVVLIIGILAAIALPQYQFAIAKARSAEALTILSSLQQAIDEYSLTHNGAFPENYNELTITPSGSLTKYAVDNDEIQTKYYRFILTGCRIDVSPKEEGYYPNFLYQTCNWHAAFEKPNTMYCYVWFKGAGNYAQAREKMCKIFSKSEGQPYPNGSGISYEL